MSQAVITKAFVEWKARQAIDNQPVVLDEFIFANVPGLDVNKPIDNAEGLPSADHIVHRQAVSKAGAVNAGSVVYSVTMGAEVGDFSFNWIGLANKATGVLAMIIHAPTQQKIKNDNGQQGNVLVRSMLMEYSGAQAATNITTPAETWQIDFTARLAGMDEAERLANKDIYGNAAFFDAGFLVAKTGQQFYVTQGVGYVGGLRAALANNENITVGVKPVKVWMDVCYQGTLTSAYQTVIKFTLADALQNYVSNGIAHYVFALASIDAAGNITDLRPKGSLNEQAGNSTFLRKDKNLTDIADPVEALKTLKGLPLTGGRLSGKLAVAHNDGVTFGAADDGQIAVTAQGVALKNQKTGRALQLEGDGTLTYNGNKVYHQGFKPLPADVGALDVNGGVIEWLTCKGQLMVHARANLLGGAIVKGGLTVSETISSEGSVYTQGDMGVKGKAYLDGGTQVKGDIDANGTAKLNGGATVKNGLTVYGDASFDNGLGVRGDFGVSGYARLKSGAEIQKGLSVTGNLNADAVYVSGDAGVNGRAYLNGGVNVSNGININGAASFESTAWYNSTDFIYKRGNQPSGTNFTTNVIRATGRPGTGLYADIYHWEQPGAYHSLNFHVGGGSADGWYEFRNYGHLKINGNDPKLSVADATFYPDGNVQGARWNGYLSDFLWNNFYGPNKPQPVARNTAGFGSNGWWRCADTGIIRQWGYIGGDNGIYTVNFPIAFPGACVAVSVTRVLSEYSSTGAAKVLNNGQMQIKNADGGNNGTYWEATGW